MSDRYQGGVIRAVPLAPISSSASGIWTMEQQAKAQAAGDWPAPGYQIERSLRFNSADSAYLNRTPASAGSRTTWTFSCWAKKCKNGASLMLLSADPSTASYIYWTTADIIKIRNTTAEYESTPVYRDPSAWYHLVWAWDTTNANEGNRTRLWVNGVEVNNWTVETHPSLNEASGINNNVIHNIGRYTITGSLYYDGYLTEINFIDGQALDPTSFGEYNTDTGVWQPKAYTGSYGTNGFYLDFADNSSTTALGYDAAGSNDWTPNNFSVTAGAGNDSLVDTPTNYGTDTGAGGEVRGNYATWNPLRPSGATLSNGNLDAVTGNSGSSNGGYLTGTFWMPESGKYYFEVTPTSVGEVAIGLTTNSNNMAAVYYRQGDVYINGSISFTGSSYTNNDVIGVAVDMDASTIRFYKNNTAQGSGTSSLSGITGPFVPCVAHFSGTGSSTVTANFGQRPFAYSAPSGFKALCTQNLPEPTVVDGGEYFNTVLYTGNGSTQSITGVGFQPDWVWIKGRSGATDHGLYDAVRGVQKQLESNTETEETTETTGLTAFGSDGFTVGALAQLNTSSATYVAWNWKANGAGVSNTDGTITSTVSANTTAGFSIVTYTGTGSAATVGHGLGVAPSMVIVKSRASSRDWPVYHKSPGNTQYAILNGTGAFSTASTFWNNTSPTSTVFSIGTALAVNASENYVAYCFAPVAGYSAFGSYVGNGSSDGPFVYTGFRPAFVMVKISSGSARGWSMWDDARDYANGDSLNARLEANSSAAEDTGSGGGPIDILSNGFKIRKTAIFDNESGSTFIYAAFAENPFKYSLAR